MGKLMAEARAIKKVGKVMGETKFHSYMSGSMLPSGEIGAARALAIAFGVSVEKVDALLSRAQKIEFDKLRNEQARAVKKADEKWRKTSEKRIPRKKPL